MEMPELDTTAYYPERLTSRFGVEHDIDGAARELKYFVQQLRFDVCGAHLITCSDETEAEAADAFQQWFARDLLPVLRLSDRAPFRTANLGGRYEWGGAAIAEHHFAVDSGDAPRKVMVFKVHSHVAVDSEGGDNVFGVYPRYGTPSVCCGALGGLLNGATGPAFAELRETFSSENVDRVTLLNDDSITAPNVRPLATAIVQARLQARRIILDLQELPCTTPTLHIVVPSVILNRPNRDGEILVGMYIADYLSDDRTETYMGLGDDPREYTFDANRSPVTVRDRSMHELRDARDHRELVMDAWRDRVAKEPTPVAEVRRVIKDGAAKAKSDPKYAKIALKAALPILIQFTPVSAALMCFAAGAVGIHQVYRMHRIATNVNQDDAARDVLAELETSLDRLPPERAHEVIEFLHANMT